jgi:glycosyltransferase involved in cell wall biosynthesis
MRIGVDATCWSNHRGYGRFTRALLNAALAQDRANEYIFFTDSESEEFPLPERAKEVRISAGVPTLRAAAADGRRSLPDIWNMSRALSGTPLDLLFFPSVYSYVPVISSAPKLVTIHDVIPEMFPQLVFPTLQSKLLWKAKRWLGCAQARLILTVSEYSRQCLQQRLGIAPSRLRVVSEASDPVFKRVEGMDARPLFARLGLPPDACYVLAVGGFSPHKNLSLLMDVFCEVQARPVFANVRLIFAGDYTSDVFHSCFHDLVQQVQDAGLQGRVIFAGYLRDQDLVALLNKALVLALPSFCEGFGLPGIEAAACGTPVIATTESPLPELLGEGAIPVHPSDRAGLRDALLRVLSDTGLRERMGSAGLAAAARLSWENSARQLLGVFDEVVHDRAASH